MKQRREFGRKNREQSSIKPPLQKESEPGAGFVLAVFVGEGLLQDAGFGARAKPLQGNEHDEQQKQIRNADKQEQPDQQDCRKNVDGVADAGIDAVGNELARLRCQREGFAKLGARDDHRD